MSDANQKPSGPQETMTITIPGGDEITVNREWVEKINAEVRLIGEWFDTNPEARADYENYIELSAYARRMLKPEATP